MRPALRKTSEVIRTHRHLIAPQEQPVGGVTPVRYGATIVMSPIVTALGGLHMMTRIPFPVTARHDIRQSTVFIRSGTPGEITGVSGVQPSYYTVTFWPRGADSASVTLSYLTTNDLREA